MDLKLGCLPVVAQRPCWVYRWPDLVGPRKKALFHGYTRTQNAVAVVEFEDGSIQTCSLNKIKFTESKSIIDSYIWDETHGENDNEEVTMKIVGSVENAFAEIESARNAITDIQDNLKSSLPGSRELSLANTKLDEARLWLGEIEIPRLRAMDGSSIVQENSDERS